MIPAAEDHSSGKGRGVSLGPPSCSQGRRVWLGKGTRWADGLRRPLQHLGGQAGRGPEAERGLTSGIPLPDTVLSEGQRHPSCVGRRGAGSAGGTEARARNLALTVRSSICKEIWQPSAPLRPYPATRAGARTISQT